MDDDGSDYIVTGGGRQGYGAGGKNYLRSRPVGLPVVAAVAGSEWIGKRMATRLTPFIMLANLVFGLPMAYFLDPIVIAAFGLGLGIITYASQRHVKTGDSTAQEWAMKTGMLPPFGTMWVLWWWFSFHNGISVFNQWTFIAYWLYACLMWAWLYFSNYVGTKDAWRAAQKDFAPIARAAQLPGARVTKMIETKNGRKMIVDVRPTGKLASKVAKDDAVPEQIAALKGKTTDRVSVTTTGRAGFIAITERNFDPWANEIPHPGAPDFNIIPYCKPTDRFPIGRDPDTDEFIYLQLVNSDGALHTIMIGGTRGGKTVTINNVLEWATRCRDRRTGRPLFHITVIDLVKGMKDCANWAPAVDEVYPGEAARSGAMGRLRRLKKEVDRRQRLSGERGWSKWIATPDEPYLLVIMDEFHALVNKATRDGREASELVSFLMRAGASEGIILIAASQRGVLQHLGSSDLKANAFNICVLPVRKSSEMNFLLPGWREMGVPDMATFGNGAKGAIAIVINDEVQSGRTFALYEILGQIRPIANSRCLPGRESYCREAIALGGSAPKASSPDPLISEKPEDGVNSDDTPDDLDFDETEDESDEMSEDEIALLESFGLTPDHPAATLVLRQLATDRPAGRRTPGVHVSGPDAEDDDAADAAMDADVHNVRSLDGEEEDEDDEIRRRMEEKMNRLNPGWHPDRTEAPDVDGHGLSAVDGMRVGVERMTDVAAWAADRERNRTPEEAARLAELWRRHTRREDGVTPLPGPANAALSALAEARGSQGFTRDDAARVLGQFEAATSRAQVNRYLRTLTNQGLLVREKAAGNYGRDVFRMTSEEERRRIRGT